MDRYRTIRAQGESEVLKVKGSKFIAYVIPVDSRDQIGEELKEIRAKHPKANHCCYAWKLGTDEPELRFNDDGEPTNSAGKPIYGQILSFELTNVLVAVIRYFGGTKLGVGGLIQAYRESAKLGIEQVAIVEKEIQMIYELKFDYARMDRVMRLIKEKKLEIISQDMDMDVQLVIRVKKSVEEEVRSQIQSFRDVKIKEILQG